MAGHDLSFAPKGFGVGNRIKEKWMRAVDNEGDLS